jgi:SAM-dependent methyltransferase
MSDSVIFENQGFCPCCGENQTFRAHGKWFRDAYICSGCGSIPRERALMWCVEKFYPGWESVVIHESSPVKRGASQRLAAKCKKYVSSQYFPGQPTGTLVNGVRCENLEALSFADNSIDLHISQDVFEHIFNPAAAFKEIARSLKPGGAHIFTTPLIEKNKPSQRWAEMVNGQVVHLQKPEYHQNPVSNEGSLVTMHWGYDICEYIARESGLFTTLVYIDALDLGIRAEYIEVLISRKPR